MSSIEARKLTIAYLTGELLLEPIGQWSERHFLRFKLLLLSLIFVFIAVLESLLRYVLRSHSPMPALADILWPRKESIKGVTCHSHEVA